MVPDGGDNGGEGSQAGEVLVQHGNSVRTHYTTVRVKQWQACGGGKWVDEKSCGFFSFKLNYIVRVSC